MKNKKEKNQMRTKLSIVLFTVLAMSFALSACGPATPPTVASVVTEAQPADVPTPTPLPAGSVQINGAGATFPLPVYTEWTYAYQYIDPSVAINYQGVGSGGGKKAIVDRTVDFAGSDSLLKDEEYQAGSDLQMYPMLAGAVVVIYTLPDLTPEDPAIILDRQTLVDIYNGKVNKWNDTAIATLNPVLAAKLPDATITVVHRSDGSGTTEIFTKALAAFSQDWTAGAGSSIEWPVDKAGNGIGGKGNQGVAATVINTPNSLGYVELSYAVSNKLPFAQMVNKAGNTVKADADTLQSAMVDFAAAFDAKLTATIVDAEGVNSWPISGYTYIILHTQSMDDCIKAKKLIEFLNWALTDEGAIKRASDLGYAPLPQNVVNIVLTKLGEVTCNGQPLMK
jgi:phosphate transport system substrate-binding protein